MINKDKVFEIYKFVSNNLIDNSFFSTSDKNDEDSKIISFVNLLYESQHANCIRLLICMGIDIKQYSRKCNKEDFVRFIATIRLIILETDNVPIPKSFGENIPPSIVFALSLRNKKCFVFSKPYLTSIEDEKYFRITSFDTFIEFIVIPNLKNNPALKEKIPEDLDTNQLGYNLKQLLINSNYKDMEISTLNSGNGWVFVGSLKELESELTDKRIRDLLNFLGFYPYNISLDTKYIWLEYPQSFAERMYKPNFLVADWGNLNNLKTAFGNEYYLSFEGEQDDFWGRTTCVDGERFSKKERAHINFNHLNTYKYKFNIHHLGILDSPIFANDPAKTLNYGIERFFDN